MSIGQGSIGVDQKRETGGGGGGTVNAANEGLSLSAGTIAQLGSASNVSATPALSAARFIPMLGFSINLQSSAAATPNNKLKFESNAITLTKEQAAGATPSVIVRDLINANIATYTPSQIDITAPVPVGTMIQLTGTNAGGAILATRFNATDTAATSEVVSQWDVDNTTDTFQVKKESNARGGKTVLQHINNTIPAARFDIVSGNAASSITTKIGSRFMSQFQQSGIVLGDLNAASTQLLFTVDVANNKVQAEAAGAFIFMRMDQSIKRYQIGDVNTLGNRNLLTIDDTTGASGIGYSTSLTFSSQPGAKKAFLIGLPGGTYSMGDIDIAANGSTMILDDTTGILLVNNTANTGSIKTGKGATAAADTWSFGSVVNAAAVLNATKYVEVSIGGVLVKLATIV